MRKMKLSKLKFDFDLYPRTEIDSHHLREMVEALKAGTEFPPIVIDKKSKRVTDGFHRGRMYARAEGPEAEVEVLEVAYKDEAAMFADAIRRNAGHGRRLSPFDRTHCLLRGSELGLEVEEVATALHITVEAAGKLRTEKVGTLVVAGAKKPMEVPLKRTIGHMSGRKLTVEQVAANRKLGGMNQLFYVNQLVLLMQNGLLDTANDELLKQLKRLGELIEKEVTATV